MDLTIKEICKMWMDGDETLEEYDEVSIINCLKKYDLTLISTIYVFESKKEDGAELVIQDTDDEKIILTQIFDRMKKEEVKDLKNIITWKSYCGNKYHSILLYNFRTKMWREFRNKYCKL